MTSPQENESLLPLRGGTYRSIALADALAAGLERATDEEGNQVTSWPAERVQD